MCEINPKRKQFFRLEFFTAHEITKDEWNRIVLETILELEQKFNASGKVRVHIHEENE